jgi:tRNA(Leu) C34 or U34 (ribose-2'-O)-methylase TrmL
MNYPTTKGFASIGLYNPKNVINVGHVLRSAFNYDVSTVIIEGFRDIKASTDTMKSYRHIPVIRTNSLKDSVPYQAVPVAIELCNDARDLRTFIHPPSAFYIFGPEDGSLGEKVLSFCPLKIMVPTKGCMNLAACVNVVLYDRFLKSLKG